MDRRRLGAAPLRFTCLLRGNTERLARDARRLLPNIRPAGRARCFDGRRRRVRRRLGARRKAGRDLDPIAKPGRRAHHPTARKSAQPRCRQPLLVRALSRAGRGDAAGGAMPRGSFGGSGCADARRPSGSRPADGRPGRLGRRRRDDPQRGRRRGRRARSTGFEPPRLSARPCARGANGRVGHPGTIDVQDVGADWPPGERD